MKTSLMGQLRIIGLLCGLLLHFGCQTKGNHVDDHKIELVRIIGRATNMKNYGNSKAARSLIDSALQAYHHAGPGDRCRLYHLLAKWYLDERKYDQANRYIDSIQLVIRPYAQEPGYDLQYAESYLMKGDVLFAQGLYSYAFQYYYKSRQQVLQDSQRKDQHTFLAHYFERQAMISYKQENFSAAAERYRQVIHELEQTSSRDFDFVYEMQGALSNLSSSYLKSGLSDSSLLYYDQALTLLKHYVRKMPEKKEFFEMARGVITGNMGDAWAMKKAYERAEGFFKTDIAINDREGRYRQDALMTKLKLARLYMKTGRSSEAGEILASVGKSPVLADTESNLNFLLTRADYNQAVGRYVEALQDLRSRSALRDSAQQYRRKLLNANMNGIFKVLEMENEKKAMEKRDRLESVTILACSLMGLVIVTLLLRIIYTSKRRVREADSQNAELQLTLQALEISNRDKVRVAALLAHDLRNPIHALSTIVTLMLDEERDAEDKEMLGLAKESIIKINLIVDDILHQDGNIDRRALEYEDIDMAALLRHSVSLLRFKAAEKQQKILKNSVRVLMMSIDQHKIWRVFNNLLVNAIKFSDRNTTIFVELKQADGYAIASIRDQGIGIPDELKDRIFTRSSEAQRLGTAGEETFGLGLYASKQIIEAHGGMLTFNCPPEGGTVFYVKLPLPKSVVKLQ